MMLQMSERSPEALAMCLSSEEMTERLDAARVLLNATVEIEDDS